MSVGLDELGAVDIAGLWLTLTFVVSLMSMVVLTTIWPVDPSTGGILRLVGYVATSLGAGFLWLMLYVLLTRRQPQ